MVVLAAGAFWWSTEEPRNFRVTYYIQHCLGEPFLWQWVVVAKKKELGSHQAGSTLYLGIAEQVTSSDLRGISRIIPLRIRELRNNPIHGITEFP
jgi:hypothetical protein